MRWPGRPGPKQAAQPDRHSRSRPGTRGPAKEAPWPASARPRAGSRISRAQSAAKSTGESATSRCRPGVTPSPSAPAGVDTTGRRWANASRILMRVPPPGPHRDDHGVRGLVPRGDVGDRPGHGDLGFARQRAHRGRGTGADEPHAERARRSGPQQRQDLSAEVPGRVAVGVVVEVADEQEGKRFPVRRRRQRPGRPDRVRRGPSRPPRGARRRPGHGRPGRSGRPGRTSAAAWRSGPRSARPPTPGPARRARRRSPAAGRRCACGWSPRGRRGRGGTPGGPAPARPGTARRTVPGTAAARARPGSRVRPRGRRLPAPTAEVANRPIDGRGYARSFVSCSCGSRTPAISRNSGSTCRSAGYTRIRAHQLSHRPAR